MADQGTEITTPVGRIVWGHPMKPKVKTNAQTRQPVLDSKTGQQIQQWSFGIAIPKAEFQASVWPAMHAEASKGYPNGVPPAFSWKYVDGDGVDREGKPYNQREGYAGHIVLAINTELQAPGVFKFENGAYRQMQPDEIKTGDFARVGVNFKVNIPTDRTHTPGLYVNPLAVEFIGYGTEIQSAFAADPNALFGGQPVALPPGASATPIGGAPGVGMPGMGAGMPMGNMPGAGAPTMGAPVQPPITAPLPAPVSAPPPPPSGPQRPADPAHIHMPGTPQEQWYINGAWTPAPAQLPPPATDFIPGAPPPPAAGGMPGMPAPR